MKQRKQLYFLVGLLALLAVVLLRGVPGAPTLGITLGGDEKFVAMDVKDPALRLDRLERIRKLAYPGMKRNIFSGELPLPPRPPDPPRDPNPPVAPPIIPAHVDLPFKFYGLTVDPRTGKRRAFFTNGEDVFIVAEGDTLMSRFRLLRIGNSTADFEEIGTGLKATLPLEQPAQPPQG